MKKNFRRFVLTIYLLISKESYKYRPIRQDCTGICMFQK